MYPISCKSIILFLATYNFVVTGVRIGTSQWITFDKTLGPVYNIFCGLSSPYTTCTYWWIISNKTVAGNGSLIEADSSRFSIEQEANTSINDAYFYGDSLQIRNALKIDLGQYACQVDKNDLRLGSRRTNVTASFYLPPRMYPKCHVTTSTTLLEDSNITFTCIPG